MSCTLAEKRWWVAGRVVLGMEDGGETYYWNEFHLVGENDQEATLVHEETETGAEWRLFTLFEPNTPMTLVEVSAKKVGDIFNLDGTRMQVTLVDESRVFYIEGTPPEGVEIGDIAHYFNAETAGRMIVVSWTGDEIEFYQGMNLPVGAVESAFGLPRAPAFPSRTGPSGESNLGHRIAKGLVLLVPLTFAIALFRSCEVRTHISQSAKPTRIPAPLSVGASGTIEDATWAISTHQVMEIAMTGRQYDRHEYTLHNPQGENRLLVCEPHAGRIQWTWFRPIKLMTNMTPVIAASHKGGDNIVLDDKTVVVTELFQTTLSQSAKSLGNPTQLRFFCLSGQSETNVYLIRWNEGEIACFKGYPLSGQFVLESFRTPASNTAVEKAQ